MWIGLQVLRVEVVSGRLEFPEEKKQEWFCRLSPV